VSITSEYELRQFIYSQDSSPILQVKETQTIGAQQVNGAVIRAHLEREILVDELVTKRIAGIPIAYDNETSFEIKFQTDGLPDLITVAGESEHTLKMENGYFVDIYKINYNYEVHTSAHFYVTLTNVISSLGGIAAIAGALMGELTVIITFHYFWHFGNALKRLSNHQNESNEIVKLKG
jgi:hypothetical protein